MRERRRAFLRVTVELFELADRARVRIEAASQPLRKWLSESDPSTVEIASKDAN